MYCSNEMDDNDLKGIENREENMKILEVTKQLPRHELHIREKTGIIIQRSDSSMKR